MNRKDEGPNKPHISIIKSGENSEIINEIKIDFPNEIKRNEYQTYFITEYEEGSCFIYAAFFANDGDKEGNVGTPLVFIFNKDFD